MTVKHYIEYRWYIVNPLFISCQAIDQTPGVHRLNSYIDRSYMYALIHRPF